MKFRNYYSTDPIDFVLCGECGDALPWFTVKDREGHPSDWRLDSVPFRLPCGHANLLFDDVIPLRGQPA